MKTSILLLMMLMSFFFCQNKVYVQGERLYNTYCSNCHGKDGMGLKNLYPPLNNSDYYEENQDMIACIILKGLEEEIVVNGKDYMMPMVGFDNLTDVDITNIINYVNTAWDNDIEETTIQQVKKDLEKCN
ncbi:c-type cytochrome [Portibacter marinus]|uniref:c-type cytochrome n=1 Tax=Portibacter marinus TaxID=2898660 RepID=UPI001F3249AD|nr:cytochrome c [Portibacter marinus]